MLNLRHLLSIAAISLSMWGCPSFTTFHTAAPIEAGTTESSLGLNYVGTSDSSIPNAEFQWRMGIDERSDFGVKYTFPFTPTFDYNYMFLKNDSLALSVDPTISPIYIGFGDESNDSSLLIIYGFLPILADVYSTESATITVAFKPGFVRGSASNNSGDSESEVNMLIGGSVGAKLKLGGFKLIPEFSLLKNMEVDGALYNLNIGFAF
jgi:hypothetical protein